MKKHIKTLLLLGLVAGTGLVSSCSPVAPSSSSEVPSTPSSEIEPSQPSEPSEPSQPSQPSGKVTVNFWHTFGQGIVTVLNDKIDEFERLVLENEGVEVEIIESLEGNYDEIQKKVKNSFPAGSTPTIAVAYPDHVADYLATDNGTLVYNIQDFIDSETIGFGKQSYLGEDSYNDESDFIESFLDEGRHFTKEGTYTIPLMKSTEVMYYNKTMVKAIMNEYKPEFAGSLDAIEEYLNDLSWTEFMDLNRFIRNNIEELNINTVEVPTFYDSDSNLFISKMYQNEIGYASIKNGVGNIDFAEGQDNIAAKEMITALKAEYDEGLLLTKGIKGEYSSNYFTSGKTVFSIGSSGGAGYNLPASDSFEVGICKVPYDNNNPLYVSQGPCLTLLKNKGLSNEENDLRAKYAWMFIKYLTNPEVNVEMCIRGSEGYVPVRYSAYETEIYSMWLEEGEEYASTAQVVSNDIRDKYLATPVFRGSAKLRDEVGSLLASALSGVKTIDKAFEDCINNTRLAM